MDPGQNPFDLQRQRITQQANAANQANQDALQRRFAAMGALNTGAALKAQQQAQIQGQQQTQDQLAGVDQAQAQQAYQEAQAQKARDFEAGQALAGRQFQGSQADIDRAIAKENFAKQFGLQSEMQHRAQDLAESESAFNRRLARYQAGTSGGLMGGGGFLGMGIGAGPADI